MIAAWMLFALEVGALMFVAAWLAERALRSTRLPVRGIWVGAMIVANVLPFVIWKLGNASSFAEKFSLRVAPSSVLAKLEVPLIALWGVAIAIGTAVCAAAVWRIARTRPLWKTQHVDNTPVLVSHDVGPALVGVMHYSIVVPEWAYSLEERARQLLLTHEREHARHYDPLLLAAAAFVVVLAPWNVFNWLFFRRLHLAVELDCDQRVLRAHPDTRGYSELLLDVAERVIPSVMPAAAFVEHGASLETRLNAMKNTKVSFQSLRVSTGVALSLAVAAAACFAPRPYAIIVVTPPATSQSLTQPSTVATEPKAFMVPLDPKQPKAIPAELQKYLNASSVEPKRNAIGTTNDVLRLVAPGARVLALDAAENARMHDIVARNAPRALGNFPRADSGLLLLLDDNGNVMKQSSLPLSTARPGMDALRAITSAFSVLDYNSLESMTELTIDRGAYNETLSKPLRLFTAHLIKGARVPVTRFEATPSRETMLATARARHPETVADTLANSNITVLLYNTQGTLLKSAVVPFESKRTIGDGASTTFSDEYVWRRAFNAMMDSGTVVQNGTLSFIAGDSAFVGPAKVMYAMMALHTEYMDMLERQVRGPERNWPASGSSARESTPFTVNSEATAARVRALVRTRVPDAYGDWSRADSAVVFLLDANDDLIGRTAGPIPKNKAFLQFADYISQRFPTVPAADVNNVGWATHISSSSGRILDKPLTVIWARLSGDATRRRELAIERGR